MRRILAVLMTLAAPIAFAHEGGHGTPEDPIGSLPKVRTSQGETFGVEGMIKGHQVVLSLRNTNNEVINPKASGFKEMATAEVTFRGATKPVKMDLKLKGNFYEGTIKGQGEEPKFKVTLNEAKGGKKQTVVLENLEQMASAPHSHGSGQPHTH